MLMVKMTKIEQK